MKESEKWKWSRSVVSDSASSWTVAHQAPPSLGFSRQEHWSGLPFPSPMHDSKKWKWSHWVVSDSASLWTVAHQAPPSMGFSRQEYWSGLPFPSPGDIPRSLTLHADALISETSGKQETEYLTLNIFKLKLVIMISAVWNQTLIETDSIFSLSNLYSLCQNKFFKRYNTKICDYARKEKIIYWILFFK